MDACYVCETRGREGTLVPDRADGVDAVYRFCPLCLDGLLSVFPITPRRVFGRQLHGHNFGWGGGK